MTREHSFSDSAPLSPECAAALAAILSEPIPRSALERVKLRAKTLANAKLESGPVRNTCDRPVSHRRRMIAWRPAAVAALVVAAIATMLWPGYSATHAFARMQEKITAVRSVQLVKTLRMFKQPEARSRMLFAGRLVRIEESNGTFVTVADFDRKQGIAWDTERKLVQKFDLETQRVEQCGNPLEELLHARARDAASVGAESLQGRRTRVVRLAQFRFMGETMKEALVWIDKETQLPVQIVVVRGSDPNRQTEIRFEEFVWNPTLGDELFALQAPAGFESGIVLREPARSPTEPPVKDLSSLDAPNVSKDGILSHDRVPCRLVWGPGSTTITALMREPESNRGAKRLHELRQWDVTTGRLRYSKTVDLAPELAISADSKNLATPAGTVVRIHDYDSGNVVREWETDRNVNCLAFSPNGKTIAVGVANWGGRGKKESGGIELWDVERGTKSRTIPEDQVTRRVRFSRNGKYLASFSGLKDVKLWEASSGKLLRIFPGHDPEFSPDGRTIACITSFGGEVATVDLYDPSSGSPIKAFRGEKAIDDSYALRVSFSPEGDLLAAADWDGTTTIWDVRSGERKQVFVESAGVHAAIFSPNGSMLVTGSENKLLRLRKLSDGQGGLE